MPYDPGTLLTVKPDILKSKIPLFKTYSISPYYTWQSSWWRNEETKPQDFQPGDNIFIVDYYGVARKVYQDEYKHIDYFYRVWVNGQEAKLQAVVLEIKDYYEVVK